MLCSICGKKRDQPLYTIFLKNFMENYLKLQTVIQKRAFIKEKYKEYCHIGCIIFFFPTIDIISEKYYLTQDKYVIDYILFGLEQIHQSKQQIIDCPICDQGLNNVEAAQKKAAISCREYKCKNQYHIECIIQVKKRVIPKKSRLYFFCNLHYDKNEQQMDWNQWEATAMGMLQESITKKQEEPYRGDSKVCIVSVDDPNEIVEEKLDQHAFKRLDEVLVKKVKLQRREPKAEPEKKRQKFWNISKDFKSQYEFGPRPFCSIDYSAKKKEEILSKQELDEEYPRTKRVKQKEEITITDLGYEVNQIQVQVKPKKQEREIKNNQKIETCFFETKNEVINLDQEQLNSTIQSNGVVSFDQLLSFVREKKSNLDPEQTQEPAKLQIKAEESKRKIEKQSLEKNIKIQSSLLNNNNNENLKLKVLPEKQTLTSEIIKHTASQKKITLQDSERDSKATLIPNADMIDDDKEEQKAKSKLLEDYSCMSGGELLNFLLKKTETKRRSRGRPKLETTRQIKKQNQDQSQPLQDELLDFNFTDWQDNLENQFFSFQKDVYTVAETYLSSYDEDNQALRVLYELGEEQTWLAEYSVEISDQDPPLANEQVQLNFRLFQQKKQKSLNNNQNDFEDDDIYPSLSLSSLSFLDKAKENEDVFKEFTASYNSLVYSDAYLEKHYQEQLDSLIKQNQNSLKQLNQNYIKDRVNRQMLSTGESEQAKLRWFQLLKSTKKGMTYISEDDHIGSIKKKIELLTTLRVGTFAGKCHIQTLKQEQKDELAKETCCKICFDYSDIELESNNDLTYCEECGVTFHVNCYNFRDCSKCDQCKNKQLQQECYLCQKGYPGIPLKLIDGNMYHITCALLFGYLSYHQNSFKCRKGIIFSNEMECFICEEKTGLKLSCQACKNECHLLCAFFWGLKIDINSQPECIDPYVNVQYTCPSHGSQENEIQQQIYYRWHGINYNQAACFETLDTFIKGKLIAHQKTYAKIQNLLTK